MKIAVLAGFWAISVVIALSVNQLLGSLTFARKRARHKNKQLLTCFYDKCKLVLFATTRYADRMPMPASTITRKNSDKMRRPYRRASERRGEIIAAAQAEFVRANFAGARTRDIAEAAGVNQATLFKHFPTKESLFQEAVMRPLIEAMQGMHGRVEVYETAASAAEMGELAVASTTRHLEDMERILPLLTTALFSETEAGRRLFQDQLEPLIRQRGEVLRPLAKDGLDSEFLGIASFGMMFAVALQRRFGDQSSDLSATARQFNRLYTSGFAREKSNPTTRERNSDGSAT